MDEDVQSDALEEIRQLRESRDSAYAWRNRQLAKLIRETRRSGETWPAIAEAMGMTRQGLDKFLKRENGAECPRCGGPPNTPQEVDPGSGWEAPLPLCDDSFHG